MTEYLWKMVQVLSEIPAREALGGLMVALILALAGSAAGRLARGKFSDPLPAFCGLILFVSFVSMALGFGHSRARASRFANSFAEDAPSAAFLGWTEAGDSNRARRSGIAPRPIQDFHPDTIRIDRFTPRD